MPGTIQVSVVNIMDGPQVHSQSSPEANVSLLSLKVAMGKREFQSMGKGDFSFPVMSLRENLIVELHDANGNEIFRTEFGTISVVEKGFVDDSFPLKGGGYLCVKLRFSLSPEEHLRIREMRESALIRKHKERLKDGVNGFISGQKNVLHSTYSTIEGEAVLNQFMQTDPDQSRSSVSPSLQISEGHSKNSFGWEIRQQSEVNKKMVEIRLPPVDIHVRQTSSEVCLDPQSGWSRSLGSDNVTETNNSTSFESKQDQIPRSKRKDLSERSSSSSVKKMITAFESSRPGPEPHFGVRLKSLSHKADPQGSFKRAASEESDMNILKTPQIIAKSFSAGMLSDINSPQNPKLFGPATPQVMVEKDKHMLELKKDMKPKIHLASSEHKAVTTDKSSYFESQNIMMSRSSSAMVNVFETFGTMKAGSSSRSSDNVSANEGPASIMITDPSMTSIKMDFKASEENVNLDVISTPSNSSDAYITHATSDPMPPSQIGDELAAGAKHNADDEINIIQDRTDEDDGTVEQSVADFELSYAVKNEAMHINKSRDEECTILKETKVPRKASDKAPTVNQSSLCIHQQRFSLSAVKTERDNECNQSHSDDEIVSKTSHLPLEVLSPFHNEGCPFGSLSMWTPRHLCVTTGSKQLRDFVEGCNDSALRISENSSTMETDEKKAHGDSSIPVKKNEAVSSIPGKSNHENSMGIPKLSGGLIEQGVRIAIIIVACGTLLLNSRQ